MNTQIILKTGDKVRYCPTVGKEENGVIKSFSDDGKTAFVVYKCNNEWSNYQNYTAAGTDITDLKIGWS